ncbi:hypothetical protein [Puia sp.]|jgi:hypothetical protein|uniref:hypothetical protein n=1 Tax=Puia sp. TaxID=2045100 RepID=UPI002F4098FC
MKTLPLIAIFFVVSVVACQKAIPEDPNIRALVGAPSGPSTSKHDSIPTTKPADTTKPVAKADTNVVAQPPFPQQTADNNNNNPAAPAAPSCPVLPIYGDSITFPQPSGSDYIVHPVNDPGPGKYFSWPIGMVLDQNTGAINLTQSQTGMRYIMGFVKAGATDTCLSELIIGGAAYYDSVYVFENGATEAAPYFEANPYLPSVCANGGCTFDVTGSAAAQKVIVNRTTGVIDLQKTLNGSLLSLGGAFGLLPVNGQTITTTITYRINYGSNNALQQIQVQLQYYDKRSLISGGLLGGIVNALDNVLAGHVISTTANPRPPLVIMVRKN